MDWHSVDWEALERLRSVFLGRNDAGEPSTPPGPYWTTAADLASYDFTLGRRIAWKWSAVLEPLFARGWTAPVRRIVDWGCGSAIGVRSLLAHAPENAFEQVILWDHSPVATSYAEAVIRERRPGLRLRVADPAEIAGDGDFLLVVSHVLNELDTTGRAALLELARRAAAVLWVEPGTSADSGSLVAVRESLRGTLHCIAPCPHDGPCGMLAPGNERHWCHHFARPPTEAFTDAGWALFARRLGVDLRSLPYSHLVLDRRAPASRPADLARIIGEPRQSTGLMRVLRCRAEGVADVELQKRAAPALWKSLEKNRHDGLFRWEERAGRIIRAV